MSRIIWLAPYPEIVDFFFLKCWFCFMCFNVGVFCNATALSYPLLSLLHSQELCLAQILIFSAM